MTRAEDFPWVQERAECSLGKVFELLRQQVRQDIEIRQGISKPISDMGGRPQYGHSFTVTGAGNSFTVILEGENQLHQRVSFTLGAHTIEVTNTNGDLILEASPSLNAEGKCIVKIGKQEYPLWHMRMMALEHLFFGII